MDEEDDGAVAVRARSTRAAMGMEEEGLCPL